MKDELDSAKSPGGITVVWYEARRVWVQVVTAGMTGSSCYTRGAVNTVKAGCTELGSKSQNDWGFEPG